jgi:magnesium chelatase family protein
MLAKINGSVLQGVEAFPVTVEVNIGRGLGYFIMGQPDDAVKECLGRIEVAIKSFGFICQGRRSR